MPAPRVLFVSKPIVPPFHDGTKCLVRDVSVNLKRVAPVVMSMPGAPALGGERGVELAPVYANAGNFRPRAGDNARAATWLAVRSRADLWHFVFAPNAKSSAMGRALSRLRRVKVVQTIASPPKSFDGVPRLLFGDVVVAQSRHTRDAVLAAYEAGGSAAPRLEVIPPPVAPQRVRRADARMQLRAELGIEPGAPIFVYPGDLEVSGGARAVAGAVAEIERTVPGAVVVFAYRAKTPRAKRIATDLENELSGRSVRFSCELPDVLVLISDAAAVLFPVDDLWGKVDLPIVLLEAMDLGVPVIALNEGPLRDLDAVELIDDASAASLVQAVQRVSQSEYRQTVIARQRAAVETRHRAAVVAERYEQLYLQLLGHALPRSSDVPDQSA
ncbi:MAG: glycosyltransferase family 4 protein [Polyangiaceae bacterium]